MIEGERHKFERKRSVMLAPHEKLVIGKPVSAVLLSEFDDIDGTADDITEDIRRHYVDFN